MERQNDEEVSIYCHKDVVSEGFLKKLEDMTQQYSREKHFDFLHCCFVDQAQDIQNGRMLKDIGSLSELKDYCNRLDAKALEDYILAVE